MLSERIAKSLTLIQQGEALALALNPNGGYYVGFSGGKDSSVLLSLVKLAGVKYTAHYSVTGIDAPANIAFIRENYPEVIFDHPKEKYIQLVRRFGLPRMNKRFCCRVTKEMFGRGRVCLTGQRAAESASRAAYGEVSVLSRKKRFQGDGRKQNVDWLQEVKHECIGGADRVSVLPLLHWSDNDIWEYINRYHLLVNPLYASVGRVGCMFCPYASRKQIEMYETMYPGFWRAVLDALRVWWARYDEHELGSVEEYYDWWKSGMSLEKYKSLH